MAIIRLSDLKPYKVIEHLFKSLPGAAGTLCIDKLVNGSSIGGIRVGGPKVYPTPLHRGSDGCGLSRDMTKKNILAEIGLGGAKFAISIPGDDTVDQPDDFYYEIGDVIEAQGGEYIGGQDGGMLPHRVKKVGLHTAHVSGSLESHPYKGDPSPATAYGVNVAAHVTLLSQFGWKSFSGLSIGVSGIGNVGSRLARFWKREGAIVTVTDSNVLKALEFAEKWEVEYVPLSEFWKQPFFMVAPCALHHSLNDVSITQMSQTRSVKIVCGCENIQLEDEIRNGCALFNSGIKYVVAWIGNNGGVIDITYQQMDADGYDEFRVYRHIERIQQIHPYIFERSIETNLPTNLVADQIVEERLQFLR